MQVGRMRSAHRARAGRSRPGRARGRPRPGSRPVVRPAGARSRACGGARGAVAAPLPQPRGDLRTRPHRMGRGTGGDRRARSPGSRRRDRRGPARGRVGVRCGSRPSPPAAAAAPPSPRTWLVPVPSTWTARTGRTLSPADPPSSGTGASACRQATTSAGRRANTRDHGAECNGEAPVADAGRSGHLECAGAEPSRVCDLGRYAAQSIDLLIEGSEVAIVPAVPRRGSQVVPARSPARHRRNVLPAFGPAPVAEQRTTRDPRASA